MTGISWFNLILILTSLCEEPQYFPVMCQWSLTSASLSTQSLSQAQHLVELSKSSSSSLVMTSPLLKFLLSSIIVLTKLQTFSLPKYALTLIKLGS